MQTFQYNSVDKNGVSVRGKLAAVNEVDLELRLQRMGLDLITARKVNEPMQLGRRGSITRQDLITFCFHMEQLSRAGIPLLEGLADLRDSIEQPRFREILSAVLEEVEGGKTLSQAMHSHPAAFDNVFVSLIKAGEQSGTMTEVFENLATTLKWQDELVAQTKRLLMYPALVFVVVGGVIVFLMMYLVPQLVSFLKNMGQELPFQTKALIFVSGVFVNYWYLVFGLPILAAVTAAVVIRRSPRARYRWDYLKLHIPFVGPILQKIILARFANFFALMYQSGITILDALKTSEEIVVNRVISDGLARAGQQISAGDSVAESFENLGMFPPLVVRMLRVGEATGALDTALLNVTYFYNREVKESVEKLLKMLEPALTVILGLVLAVIMFSVLTPIYDILGKMKY
ncbi:type II secretion system protein [Sulfurimicrobium lacus]|uniref:Type II secretion system protein n=1 Tax=Sulfurimicrobium lacus TaxID=2715678 RepID=A0A6F8V6U2_9PROT|nr:type II secretion system F family protein [Sulfurimicrobium lacus]BCB25553.1 type II secretion system protein [Sulfurimicrobium lacus]